MPGFSFQ